MQAVVLADDLTGAADTAVHFARAGLRAMVTFDAGSARGSACDVMALSTGTRGSEPAEAYSAVRAIMDELARALAQEPLPLLYKKIDSGLRGNVGTELLAVLHALQPLGFGALVAPALPEQGRTTVNGVQLIHGVPVSETATGRDPFAPVTESCIPRLLAQAGHAQVSLIPLAEVRAGAEAVRQLVRNGRQRGCSLFVADAETGQDLAAVVEALWGARSCTVWVGTAGLARAVCGRLQPRCRVPGKRLSFQASRWLTVCGSLHPVSRGQVMRLAEATGVEVTTLPIQAQDGAVSSRGVQATANHLLESLAQHGQAVVVSPPPGHGGRADLTPGQVGQAFRQLLSYMTSLREYDAAVLFVGGDTAAAGFAGLGAQGFWLCDELLPGAPVGAVWGGPAHGMVVVTKSGHFGGAEVLIQIAEAVTAGS